jgi:hypothetical protein
MGVFYKMYLKINNCNVMLFLYLIKKIDKGKSEETQRRKAIGAKL